MNEWALYLILLAGSAVSLFLTIVQLPGLWLMVGLAAAYAYITGGQFLGIPGLVIILLLAFTAEVLETLSTAAGARKAGASKTAMVLSVVGAIIGGVCFTLIPIPVIGTIIGVCLGAFAGGAMGELLRGRDGQQSMKSGLGAAAGRLAGTLAKLALGVLMFLVTMIAALPTDAPAATSAGTAAAPSVPAPTSMQVEQSR